MEKGEKKPQSPGIPRFRRYIDKWYIFFQVIEGLKAIVRTSRGKNDGNWFETRACDARTPHVASEY